MYISLSEARLFNIYNMLRSKCEPLVALLVYTLAPLTNGRGGGNISDVGNVRLPEMAGGSGIFGLFIPFPCISCAFPADTEDGECRAGGTGLTVLSGLEDTLFRGTPPGGGGGGARPRRSKIEGGVSRAGDAVGGDGVGRGGARTDPFDPVGSKLDITRGRAGSRGGTAC